MVEASPHDGPTLFNCFPNFFVSHQDPGAFEAINLGIHTKGFNIKPQSQNVAIVYRIYYKVMNTIVPEIAYSSQTNGVITLFLTTFKKKYTTPM